MGSFDSLATEPFYYFIVRCLISLSVVLGSVTLLTFSYRRLRDGYNARRKKNEPTIPFRTSVEMFLISSGLNDYFHCLQAALSIISVIIYVYGTYQTTTPIWYPAAEMALIGAFTLNWMLEFYLSKNRLLYAFSGLSIVDILTVSPLFWDLFEGNLGSELNDFRLMRAIRVLRILRLHQLLPYVKHEVHRAILHASINVFSLVFCISGLQIVVELNSNTGMPMQFHESVYWCIVTMATVGYGDVHPNTAEGMFITDVLILLSIVLIPFEVNVISAAISSFTPFKRDLSNTAVQRHIVVCGEVTYSGILEFLAEIYSQQRGKMKTEVVILSPKPVSPEMNTLLNHPFYSNRVIYLQGSPMSNKDLSRAKISRASSCFIFSPEFWCSTDAPTIMAALSLREASTGYKVYAQIISSDARSKVVASGVTQHLCREEWRMALLAQSCLCPGLSTLISNLFASRPRMFQRELWLREYTYGSLYSIFRIEVPDVLFGKKFSDAVLFMYFTMKCLPLGVEVLESVSQRSPKDTAPSFDQTPDAAAERQSRHVLLNPSSGNLVLSQGDFLYVLAQNKKALLFDEQDTARLETFRQDMQQIEIAYLPTGFEAQQYKEMARMPKQQHAIPAPKTAPLELKRPREPASHKPKIHASDVIQVVEKVESKIERGQAKIARRLLSPYQVLPDDLPPAFIDITKSSRARELEEQTRVPRLSEIVISDDTSPTSAAPHRHAHGKQSVKFSDSNLSTVASSSFDEVKSQDAVFDFFGASPTTTSFEGRSRSISDPPEAPVPMPPPPPSTAAAALLGDFTDCSAPSDVLRRVCQACYDGSWSALLSDAKHTMANSPSSAAKLKQLAEHAQREMDSSDERPMHWGITKSTSFHDFARSGSFNGTNPGSPLHRRRRSSLSNSQSSQSQELYGFDMLPQGQDPELTRLDNAFDLDFRHHIVVCGGIKSLRMFVKPLRAKYLKTMKPIVILNLEEPEDEEWAQILKFPEIYFIQGSGTKAADLKRAGVEHADQVVILSDPYAERSSDEEVDRNAILTHLELLGVDTDAKVVLELVHETNLRYITGGKQGDSPEALAQQLAEKNLELTKPLFYLLPEFASGRVCAFSFLDSVFFKAYHQDYLFDLAYDLTFGLNNPRKPPKGQPSSFENKFLSQVEVPIELVGCTYGELLKDFVCNRGLLPLGLYRCKESTQAPTPYVFTCPQQEAPVHPDDRVFVISQGDGSALKF